MFGKMKFVLSKRGVLTLLAAGLITVGSLLLFLGSSRAITILVDGQPQGVTTRALTVKGALRAAGLDVQPGDRLQPPANRLIGWNADIQLERSRPVRVWQPGKGLSEPFTSPERITANLLLQAGIRLFPNDRILWNGLSLTGASRLPPAPGYVLQFQPAAAFKLETGSQVRTLYASAPTLAGALWQAGIRLSLADATSLPPASVLTGSPVIALRRAVPISILVSGGQIEGYSSAPTVGRALADAGVSLQGLDYSVPTESELMPSDGMLRVVRVREEVILEQKTIPFENEYAADPELELDQRNVLESGQYGLQVNRLRVRYEDGKEIIPAHAGINRQSDAEWVAAEPKKQVVGYGTRVVIRTTDTPDGPIEYWRAVRMYATSYSPCRSGGTRCYPGTASGLPVQKGVAAVLVRHFLIMRGQRVYVPGYGSAVIGDTGGGIPGRLWIDLAYSDDDYQSWHSWTTVYFLTPVPAVIPYILN